MKTMLPILAAVLVTTHVASAANVGEPAPAFTLTDSSGATHKLSDFKGKFVVLEWINPDCPFVKKHYNSGNMQKLQKEAAAKGVVWLSVASSAPGKQGHYDAAGWTKLSADNGSAATAVLLDADGTVGKAYGARTTPNMFVISPEGTLIYAGAIDDKSGTDAEEIATAKNYVMTALEEAMAGKPVTTAVTKPYGCSVKYAE